MLLLLPDGFIVELCVIIWRNTKPNPFPLLTQKYIFFFNGKKCHRSHWNCCTATGTGKELLFFCLFWKRILRAFFKFLIPRFFVYYKRRCKSRGDCPFGVERKEKGKKEGNTGTHEERQSGTRIKNSWENLDCTDSTLVLLPSFSTFLPSWFVFIL